MFNTPHKRRGRGAQTNRSGRFEPLQRMDVDDGWPSHELNGLPEEADATARTQWREDHARSIITKNDSPDLHFNRSINPYRGCEHGCSYCFARPSHTYLGHSAGLDFERLLYAKLDAAELLERELARPGYVCEPIAIGVNTDAYQPLEKQLGITRQLLEVMVAAKHPVYLITKGSLIERDLDLLKQLAAFNLVTVAFSVTTLDNELSHRLEPRASAPHRRLRTMRVLADAGIPVRVSVSPIIPALNEHEMDAILEASAKAGARAATALLLRLPHELATLFPEWLEEHYPLKKQRVLNAIRSLRGGRLNNSDFETRFSGEGPRAQIIQQRFQHACKRYGMDSKRQPFLLSTEHFTPLARRQATVSSTPAEAHAQLALFT